MASTQLAKRSQKDALDSFFEFTERLMCPIDDGVSNSNYTTTTKNRGASQTHQGGRSSTTTGHAMILKEPDEDLLDYTFNAVESFTCADDVDEIGGRRGGGLAPSEPSYLTRDNSLVESLPGNNTSTTSRALQKRRTNKDGDVIDYVFEHVESFVCADDMPNNHTVLTQYAPVGGEIRVPAAATNNNSSRMPTNITSANVRNIKKYQAEEIYEPDDEIQLFFRPRR